MTEATPITVINVFALPAGQVDGFVAGWRVRAETMAAAPGFLDSRLHRAVSTEAHFALVNVAHWDSAAAMQAARDSGVFQERIRDLHADPAQGFTAYPGVYEVVAAYDAPIR